MTPDLTRRRVLLTVALGCALALAPAAPRSHAAAIDGEWTVDLVTESGRCQPTYRHPITIRDGIVSGRVQGRTGSYAIDGTASTDGKVDWKTSGGPDPGVFQATITDDRGRGEWFTQSCRGVLTIRRP